MNVPVDVMKKIDAALADGTATEGPRTHLAPPADTLTFTVPYPPSVNTYYRSVIMGDHVRVLLSERGRSYGVAVVKAVGGIGHLEGPLKLDVTLNPPDRRVRDIDNPMKSLMDSLRKADLYDDDSQVRELTVRWGRVGPGTAEVTLTRLPHHTLF